MKFNILTFQSTHSFGTNLNILVDGRSLPIGPEFETTKFTRNFFYSSSQIRLNILLGLISSLKLPVAKILTEDKSFQLVLSDDKRIRVVVVLINSRDQQLTHNIFELSAGLQQWIAETHNVKQRLTHKNVSFVISSIPSNMSIDELMAELKTVVSSEWLVNLSQDSKFVKIPPEYKTLSTVGAEVLTMATAGNGPYIQVTRGALSVPSPQDTAFEVQVSIAEVLKRVDELFPKRDTPFWLTFWFQSLYELFSVEQLNANQLAKETDDGIDRLFVVDGSKILDIDFRQGDAV